MSFVQLSDQITEYFNGEELADLCYRLGVQYENLPGGTVAAKARELTEHCRRRGRVDDLITTCRERRPHVLWAFPTSWQEEARADERLFDNPPTDAPGPNIPSQLPQMGLPPQAPGMFWMPYPDTWYGPFYGFYIGWMSVGGFQVWHPMMGPILFPDPYRQLQRNMWVRLFNSPFNVFVDDSPSGHVFAQYSSI